MSDIQTVVDIARVHNQLLDNDEKCAGLPFCASCRAAYLYSVAIPTPRGEIEKIDVMRADVEIDDFVKKHGEGTILRINLRKADR